MLRSAAAKDNERQALEDQAIERPVIDAQTGSRMMSAPEDGAADDEAAHLAPIWCLRTKPAIRRLIAALARRSWSHEQRWPAPRADPHDRLAKQDR